MQFNAIMSAVPSAGEQIMKLFIIIQLPITSSVLGSNILLEHSQPAFNDLRERQAQTYQEASL